MALSSSSRFGRDTGYSLAPGPAQYETAISAIRVGRRNRPLPARESSKKFLAPTEDEIAVATAAATAALEEARTIADGPTRKKKLRKKKKRAAARPCSAIEAAAQEAAVKTTFGTSGRGNASHWSWVKGDRKPDKSLDKTTRKRQRKKSKKKKGKENSTTRFGGVVEPTYETVAKTLPKQKFRKPRKDPSMFHRPPIDIDNYVASHTHLGMTYSGSFGDPRAQTATSRQGTFSSGSRADRAERIPRADMSFPAPNQYGDVNPTFGQKREDRMRMAKWVEDVKMLPGGSRKIDRAVATLAELPRGCSMLSQQRRYKTAVPAKGTKKAKKKKRGQGVTKRAQKKLLERESENVSGLENHIRAVKEDKIASNAEMALLKARLRSAGFVVDGKKNSVQTEKNAKRQIPEKVLKAKRLRKTRQISASPSFGNAGLGGTGERFPTSAGTFFPGPGHYGDFNAFKAAPRRPMSAASVLAAMERVQRETIAFEREGAESASSHRSNLSDKGSELKRARSASALSRRLSQLPPRETRNFTTFGASDRGSLLDYQRRYGIGIGGQASPGPAHYGIPQRSERCFGGRIKSANRILQNQEENQRRIMLLDGDKGKDIRKGVELIRKRAQRSSQNEPKSLQNASSARSLSAHHKKMVSPFRLKKMPRPSSAPLSPGKRDSLSGLSCTAPPLSYHVGNSVSSRPRVTIRQSSRRSGKKSPNFSRRPASASGGVSSPSHPSRQRPRPASSKPRGSPDMRAQTEASIEDEYLVDEDSDWENDVDETDDETGNVEAKEGEKSDTEAIAKNKKPSRREMLANVKELAKRAQELSLVTRERVDKLLSE